MNIINHIYKKKLLNGNEYVNIFATFVLLLSQVAFGLNNLDVISNEDAPFCKAAAQTFCGVMAQIRHPFIGVGSLCSGKQFLCSFSQDQTQKHVAICLFCDFQWYAAYTVQMTFQPKIL